jgi:transposase
VEASPLKEFHRAIQTLKNWQTEILNSFAFGLNNGFIEGLNNQTKVIKRHAFGFRRYDRLRNCILLHHQFKHQIFGGIRGARPPMPPQHLTINYDYFDIRSYDVYQEMDDQHIKVYLRSTSLGILGEYSLFPFFRGGCAKTPIIRTLDPTSR